MYISIFTNLELGLDEKLCHVYYGRDIYEGSFLWDFPELAKLCFFANEPCYMCHKSCLNF